MLLIEKEQERPTYVKLTPGTDLHRKVSLVATALGVPKAQAARYMMRNGFIGFRRFAIAEGMEVVK